MRVGLHQVARDLSSREALRSSWALLPRREVYRCTGILSIAHKLASAASPGSPQASAEAWCRGVLNHGTDPGALRLTINEFSACRQVSGSPTCLETEQCGTNDDYICATRHASLSARLRCPVRASRSALRASRHDLPGC
jgi:hypothetical protein